MSKPQSLDGELFAAIMVEMIRDGLVPAHIMERVRQNFEYQADTASYASHEDRTSTLSRMALEIEAEASGPSLKEWHDKRALREDERRAAYLSRRPDGGKPPA